MVLTNETFPVFAMKNYDNPVCTGIDEFNEDIRKFNYIQKLLKRKHHGKKVNISLILNHIITVYNLFGVNSTVFLFFKIKEEYWHILKPFLVYLNYRPDNIRINDRYILSSSIEMDLDVIDYLRTI